MILGGRLPGKVDSCRNEKPKITAKVVIFGIYSSIAQLAERMTVNHDVAGSSPAGGAKTQTNREA